MANKKIIIFAGANGSYNLGDDAMFESLVDHIRKFFNGIIVTDGEHGFKSKYAQEVIPYIHETVSTPILGNILLLLLYSISSLAALLYKKFQVKFPFSKLNLYIEKIHESELIIFAGMGAMNDRFFSHGILGRGIITNIARVFQKKVIISGNGIGPIEKKRNKLIVKTYIQYFDKIFVRDSISSKKQLMALGCQDQNIFEAVDDAFFLKVEENDLSFAENLLEKENIRLKEFIVINIHLWNDELMEDIFMELSKTIEKFEHYDIVLLPNYFSERMDDRIVLEQFKNYMIQKNPDLNIFLLQNQISARQSKAILSYAYFTVATRYHVGVFSLSMGTPVIMLALDNTYYLQKMQGLLHWYELTQFALSFNEVNSIQERAKAIFDSYEILEKKIQSYNDLYQRRGFLSVQYLHTLFLADGKNCP